MTPNVSINILLFDFHIDIKYREYVPMPYNCIRSEKCLSLLTLSISVEAAMDHSNRRTEDSFTILLLSFGETIPKIELNEKFSTRTQ